MSIDYKLFAQVFYKELRARMQDMGSFSQEVIEMTDLWYEQHYEEEYPLPDWAESRNTTGEICLGAQLCTKDGRRMGNARIVGVDRDNPLFPKGSVLWVVRTDVGTEINMLPQEVHGAFWIGKYIMKPGE